MIIQQNGLPLCAAASAAMAAGSTLEEFIEEVGEKVGYTLSECAGFLIKRGVLLAINPGVPIPYYGKGDHTEAPYLTPEAEVLLKDLVDFWGGTPDIVMELALLAMAASLGLSVKVSPASTGKKGSSSLPTGYPTPETKQRGFICRVPITLPALLRVRYIGDEQVESHMVFWNGIKVLDPNFPEPQSINNYTVQQWHPLMHISTRQDHDERT